MERRRIGRDVKESKALYNAVVVVVFNSLLSRWPMANKTY